jgi:hypothetical protein
MVYAAALAAADRLSAGNPPLADAFPGVVDSREELMIDD